jgi:hypothetical protein
MNSISSTNSYLHKNIVNEPLSIALDFDPNLQLWYKFTYRDINSITGKLRNYGTQTSSVATAISTTNGSVISFGNKNYYLSSLYTSTAYPGFGTTFIFPSGNYCISFWKYITAFGGVSGSAPQYGNLLHINTSPYPWFNLWTAPNVAGPLAVCIPQGNYPQGGNLTVGSWIHLIINYDGTNYKMYQNGNVVYTSTTNFLATYPGLSITMYVDGIINQFIPGYLSDFRLFNRSLTAAEISSLYTYSYS